jgi:hypothetical protein
MYVKIFESREIRIEDEDMKKLLKRFNANEFKLSSDGRCYVNRTACALCARHNKYDKDGYCSGCPFTQFAQLNTPNTYAKHGCSIVMDKLLRATSTSYRAIFVTVPGVIYYTIAYDKALEELKIITDFLKSFKKE